MHKTESWRYFTVFAKDMPRRDYEPSTKTVKMTLDLGETVIHELDHGHRLVVRRDFDGEVHVTKEKRVSMWVPDEE